MTEDWITTREAAKLSQYHPDHIRILVRSRRIRAQKFGEVWQISRSSLLAYLQEQAKRGERRGRKPFDVKRKRLYNRSIR
jgi:excisionase family DNA binding protein